MAYVIIDGGELSGVRWTGRGFGRTGRGGQGIGRKSHGLSGPLKLTIEHIAGLGLQRGLRDTALQRLQNTADDRGQYSGYPGLRDDYGRTDRSGRAENRGRGVGLHGLAGLGAVTVVDARGALEKAFLTTTAGWVKLLDEAIDNTPTFPLLEMNSAKSNLKTARSQIAAVNDTAVGVIRNAALPLNEVEARVITFVANYSASVQAQMDIAKATSQRATMVGQLTNLKDAFRTVVKSALSEAGEAVGDGIDAATKTSPLVMVLGGVVALAVVAYSWRSFR